MKIERIDHVHIKVKDLRESMKFFSDLLGTQFVGPIVHSDHEIAFDNSGIELPYVNSRECIEGQQRGYQRVPPEGTYG